MALPSFTTWFPTASRWVPIRWRQEYRLIVDNETAVPIGIVNQNANGAQGIWGMTPVSLAQVESPTADMLQDLAATFQLNQSPYTRYQSDGIQLVAIGGGGGGTVVPPGVNEVWFSPLQVTEAGGPLTIQGGVRLIQ